MTAIFSQAEVVSGEKKTRMRYIHRKRRMLIELTEYMSKHRTFFFQSKQQ